ncbi:MAG: (2Fe-2S)-binding protein [Anaerolineales bacterium]|nr:(2Fe-2S)-binding protein [Anaerolineales bacterium]
MPAFLRANILAAGQRFEILVNGEPVAAYEGESLAAALLAAGWMCLAAQPDPDCPRSLFCGMGACYGCLVTLDGRPNVRSCATLAQPGQRVELADHAIG